MKNFSKVLLVAAMASCSFLSVKNVVGQVSIATVPSTTTQNFTALGTTGPITWTDNTTPLAGWYSTTVSLPVNSGGTNSNNVYNFGTTSAADRALGGLSTTMTHRFAIRMKNNSSSPITNFDISFTGEQWRQNAASQTLVFEYQMILLLIP